MGAPNQLKELFAQALKIEAPVEREKFLAEACTGQPELRMQLDSLLAAHDQAGDFLAQTMKLPMVEFESERMGSVIGRYKLLEKIGEGGFGVVYMAEQQEPVQRKVALKIIKAGMDTREVIARFEAERQALALMDHPNIAKVLDAGTTETKRPYFVMELVRGIPITDYCDEKNLSTTERLQLFIKVCQAIQHAHQKAVIHRDLKPSNILVTLHDGEPVPKVIDFGVAKALGQKLTEKTLFTSFRQMIGTPAYMSPEQAEMSGLDIDTRSDIYSLGVLLYELLTGVTPFDKELLAKATLDEIRRMIRETEPLKPSTRLRTLGEKIVEVARQRRVDSTALSKLVRGDLDWIVMKCLEKDRTRRYETANGLNTDIRRFLNNEPVTAAAPSALYRAQKFARRHRVGLTVTAGFVLLLAAAAAVSTLEAVRATHAERKQTQLRKLADAARTEESVQRQNAATAALESHERSVRLLNANGIHLVDEDELANSLPWFAEALSMEQGQPERADLQRIRINAVLQRCPKPVQIFFHGGPITCAHFSRDYRLVVTASRDHTARIWDMRTGMAVGSILQHTGIVWQAAFSRDSHWVVTASEDGTARVWDAQTGLPATRPLRHQAPVLQAIFNPNGTTVATASEDHTVRLWDVETGELLSSLAHPGTVVRRIDFSPDGSLLATGGDDGKVWIWRTSTGRKISPIDLALSGPITSVQFNSGGNHLLTSSLDGSARVWSVEKYNIYLAILNHNGPVLHSSFSPSGQNMVAACGTGAAQVYAVPSFQPTGPELLHRGAIHWAEFDSEGRRVVTASADRTAAVWEVGTGQMAARLRHGGAVKMAEFSFDGRFVLTASDDCTARIWPLTERQTLYRTVQDEPPVWHSAIAPDATTKVVLDERQTEVATIEPTTPGVSPVQRIQHSATIRDAAFSHDGRWLATAGDDQTARVWSARTGHHVSPPLEHRASVWRVIFSQDGRFLATATAERAIRVWDVTSGEPVTPNIHQDGPITNLAFSSDGSELLVSGEGGSTRRLKLTPANLSAHDLSSLAELLAGRRLDDSKTSLEPSSTVSLSNLWESVGKQFLSDFLAPVPGPQQPGESANASDTVKTPNSARTTSSSIEIPDRDPQASQNQVNLTTFYNAALTQGWHTPAKEEAANNLSELPRGLVELGKVTFDVRGILQVSGQSMKAQGGRYPEQINGIPVERKCAQLHFLQGTGWKTTEGVEIGAYIIHLADGRRTVLPITYGQDVRDWWFSHTEDETASGATIVWQGANPQTRKSGSAGLRLYLSTWTNPTPEIVVKSVDLISAMTSSAPFLIAITAEP
jgi:eukaryotic-like serine/threonine-protein kinase